jgi:hypothetical protein
LTNIKGFISDVQEMFFKKLLGNEYSPNQRDGFGFGALKGAREVS